MTTYVIDPPTQPTEKGGGKNSNQQAVKDNFGTQENLNKAGFKASAGNAWTNEEPTDIISSANPPGGVSIVAPKVVQTVGEVMFIKADTWCLHTSEEGAGISPRLSTL